jgi:PAS domain S-box-containing protein
MRWWSRLTSGSYYCPTERQAQFGFPARISVKLVVRIYRGRLSPSEATRSRGNALKIIERAQDYVISKPPYASKGPKRRRTHVHARRSSPPAPVARRSANGANQELRASHRDYIAELEVAVARLQEHVEDQNATITSLGESRSRFYELFVHSPLAYLVHDGSGFIEEINSAGEHLLGLQNVRARKACVGQFLVEEDLVLWLNHVRECSNRRRQTITELRLRNKQGKVRQVQLVTVPGLSVFPHKPRRFYTIVNDISRHQAAELALSQTQRDYERLIDMIEGIVWEADARTLRFIYVSRYAERLLGYSISDWTSPGFWQTRIYVQDRDRVLNQVNRAIAKGTELRLDYRVVAADRRLVRLHDSIRVVERKGVHKLLGVAIDVTEQRNAEDQMREAHASLETKVAERTAELQKTVSELEAFSYSLSHDLRAPIRAMRGYAELLEHMVGDKLGPKAPEFLRRIMSSAERLDLLVQDVLQFNRVSRAPVEMKPIALDPLINNILHDYPVLAPAKAQIEVRQPLLPIRGHEAFVGQALLNLLTNAVKFVPRNRTAQVRLWTEETRRTGDTFSSRKSEPNRWVRIWVEDNGLGISAEDQKRIFRMFERVYSPQEFEGTGIGLAIVQKAVERMGGQVGVESSPGQGSKFWIELPLA